MALLAITKETDLHSEGYQCFVNKCWKRGISEKVVSDLDVRGDTGTLYCMCEDHCSDDFVIEFHQKSIEAEREDYEDSYHAEMEERGSRHA